MAEQAGRFALVTGANTGIGFEAALQLARKGAHVLLGCRDQQRAEQAIERIQAVAAIGSVEWLPLDLADLTSVSTAAAQLSANHQHLDLLICNAGVMVPPEGCTADGFELQFGINHLGHFALVLQLLPLLLRLFGTHLQVHSDRIMKAMVLERLDQEIQTLGIM